VAFHLLYLDEVETDILQAKIWYKAQRDGLENEFATAIEKAIQRILLTPHAYSIRYKNIRIAHPKKFPFNIHFFIKDSDKTVVITAVIHSKRHPNSVKKRKL
jgi:hypothetical protein